MSFLLKKEPYLGAIGANGAFAALDIEGENEERLGMQRVVVSLFSVGSLCRCI